MQTPDSSLGTIIAVKAVTRQRREVMANVERLATHFPPLTHTKLIHALTGRNWARATREIREFAPGGWYVFIPDGEAIFIIYAPREGVTRHQTIMHNQIAENNLVTAWNLPWPQIITDIEKAMLPERIIEKWYS